MKNFLTLLSILSLALFASCGGGAGEAGEGEGNATEAESNASE
jgi:hypothetical protein